MEKYIEQYAINLHQLCPTIFLTFITNKCIFEKLFFAHNFK